MKSIGHTVDGLQHAKRFGLVTHQTLSGVDTQVQLQRSVDLVVALVVTLGAFEIAQVLIAQAKAQAALVVRQAQQPIGNTGVLGVVLGLVPLAALTDREHLACQVDAGASLGHNFFDHLAAATRPSYVLRGSRCRLGLIYARCTSSSGVDSSL